MNQGSRPAGAIRSRNWKLIEHYEDGRVELFNLKQDPGEKNDLANQEPRQVYNLKAALVAWRLMIGAQVNTPNPNFDPALHKKLYEDVDVSMLKAEGTAEQMRLKLKDWRQLMNDVLPKPKKENKP
jgi:hypothetical protein